MNGPTIVVQARMGSTRLPGKVLIDIAGRPLLGFMLARLAPLVADGATVVVATTDLARDDEVADVAAAAGTPVVRGSEADVLGRFGLALDAHAAEHVVRLTADCPLVDPRLVAATIARHLRTGADYTSNTLVRTYPDGLDVEVLRADVLRRAATEAANGPEREHVTPFVYRRPRRFTLAQLTGTEACGDERWTVDEPEDLDVIREAVAAVADPTTASWTEFLAVLGRRPISPPSPIVALPGPEVDHRPGQPYERGFVLHDPVGTTLGRAGVVVDDGVGRLSVDLDEPSPALHEAATAAVRRWLTADLQVTHLVEPEGTTP